MKNPVLSKLITKNKFIVLLTLVLLVSVFTAVSLVNKPKEIEQSQAALQGDCNSDSTVNILDFQLLSNSFGKSQGQTGFNVKCDFNSDTVINILDFQILSNNFGKTGPTPTPPGSGGSIINETFSATVGSFNTEGGLWGVTSGRYEISSPSTTSSPHLNNISIHNTSVSGDFILETDARSISLNNYDDFAIIFGYQDNSNYYFVSFNETNDGGTSGIFKVQNGTVTELADISSTISAGTNYQIRIVRTGSLVSVYLNGSLAASANDSTFQNGRVGYGSKDNKSSFDNLMVTGTAGLTSTPAPTKPGSTGTPTPRPSTTPKPSPTSGPVPTIPPTSGEGIWISQQEIMSLPTSGTAWNNLKSWANKSIGTPTINNQDSDQDQIALAKAYTCARQDINCSELITALNQLSSKAPSGDRALAWGRNISAWIISADILINSGKSSGLNTSQFRNWVNTAINTNSTSGGTVSVCHENWRNNWGTMCGGSRIAALAFLGNSSELSRAWDVFRGYVGDYSAGAYKGFNTAIECTNWRCPGSCDDHWINPKSCTKDGRNFDGINPSEMYRQGDYSSSSSWPPPMGTTYPFNGLGGLLVQAEILSRKNYPTWNVADSAILRAYSWMIDEAKWNINNASKQSCLPWLINKRYGKSYPAPLPATPGQNTGFCDWTYSK